MGKQGGRGGKGQTARSGVRLGGFEGGQMPLHRRLPKRGFNKLNRKIFNEVPLGRLQAAVDASLLDPAKPVDVAALKAAGVIRRPLDGVRMLGGGELKAKLALTVNHATAGAKAGGGEGRRVDHADREEGAAGRRGQAQEIGRQEGQDRQAEGGRERGIAVQ